MEEDSTNLPNEDPFAMISKTSRVSTSQEHLLQQKPFIGDTRTSQDMPSQFEPEIPISSAPILILSPPDTQDVPQDVFHTPPEEYSLPSSDVDVPHCPVNQAADVDSGSQVFVDSGKDSELGFLDGRLKNGIDADFVPEDEFRVSERGISDLGESPVKKLKLGFDSLGNSLGGQQPHSVVDGVRNSEEEKVESPCNVVVGEQVNDVNNDDDDDFCREIPMDDNSVPEENVEAQVVQNAGDVNLVEIGEGSGIREDPVLRVLPNSIRCLLEKSTATATANGVEPEKVEEKNKFSVFDVLKILSENTVEEEDDGLTMLEAAKRSGGACGFGDYGKIVNDGSVAAVSAKLWKNGGGCGACYQVRCKIPQYCDDNGAYVVVTDYGEGDRTDFILSPRAFSRLGRNAVTSEKLKKYGVLDVEYKRVPCTFKGNNIVYQINENSRNPGYFSINILYVGGTYDVTAVEMWQKQQHQWEAMRRSYGAVFDFANPPEGEIRLKFQVSSNVGSNWVVSRFTIPAGWKAGATYSTKIQPY